MRSRRLLIILVVFIMLAGTAIIGGTVFRIKNIDVKIDDAAVLDAARTKTMVEKKLEKEFKGKNILFNYDKKKISAIVEETEIFLKVKSITIEAPNKIVVTTRERKPVFLYRGLADTFVIDTDMRVLYKNNYAGAESDLTDISPIGTNLFQTSLKVGDFVQGDVIIGDNAANKEKIALINFIPQFFASTGGYEATVVHQIRGIKFNPTVDGVITMRIEVQPENRDVVDVRLMIMKAPNEDFSKLFEMVWATMVQRLPYGANGTKQSSQSGVYVIYYNAEGKMEVIWYSALTPDADDDGFPDRTEPDAKFVEKEQP